MGNVSGASLANGWLTLASLHALIEHELERSLQKAHGLSVVEHTAMVAMRENNEGRIRMQQLGHLVQLSPSAVTRLVTRLETRGFLARVLCGDDRRGIYTQITPAGIEVLDRAAAVYQSALDRGLAVAGERPEFQSLISAMNADTDAPTS